ncbi:MAG: hypothetical protein AB7V36_04445 [Bacteroidales bacterium]|jgi:hypothetical protein|nr:hypothetical protein [Bacteroidales bacterium]
MLRFCIVFFVMILVVCGLAQAQDTLYLMSGRLKTNIHVLEMDSSKIAYAPGRTLKVNRRGLVRTMYKERQDVFEIRYEDGTRELAYIMDSSGYIITPEQAGSYVDGCHDAFLYSHNRIVGPVCYLITLGSIFVLPPIAVIAVPCVYSAATIMFTPEFPADRVDEERVDKFYILGYQDTRKIKKVKSSMFFGIAAIVTGFVITFTTK